MKTKLKDVVLSVLKETGVEEKDVVFLFDRNNEKETVLWGFGIKGETHIGAYWMNHIHLELCKYVENNHKIYSGIANNSTPVCTFRYGYGIVFSQAVKEMWTLHMKDQEREWKEFNFYEEESSGFISKFLSRLFFRRKQIFK